MSSLALASQAMNGQLEFFNVDEFEIMNAGEHFMCTDIEWDPTGRYVATSVTSIHQMENGFNIWSWNGHLLYRRVVSARTANSPSLPLQDLDCYVTLLQHMQLPGPLASVQGHVCCAKSFSTGFCNVFVCAVAAPKDRLLRNVTSHSVPVPFTIR